MGQPAKVNYEFLKRPAENQPPIPVYQLVDELVTNYHPDLIEAKIGVTWHHGLKPDRDGKIILGLARKIGDPERQAHGYDLMIVINKPWWEAPTTTAHQKEALMFHELCHPRLVLDENGDPKMDQLGRKIYYLRKHDFEDFHEVIQKYGLYKDDLQRAAATIVTALNQNNPPAVDQALETVNETQQGEESSE